MQTEINQKDAQGRRHGHWELHHENRKEKLWYKGEYVHGIPHGPWIEYRSDGSLWYKQNFDMGKRSGYSIWYDIFSSVASKQFYAN